MVRDALARTVRAAEPGAEIVEAEDYAGVEAGLLNKPDLVLLDIDMPGMNGIAGVRRVRDAHPALRLIVASGNDDPAIIRAVLAMGVAGFLPKAEPAEVLIRALRLVLSGGTYTPLQALGDFQNGQLTSRPVASGLTARQMDVLRLLMRGEPNKGIARQLGLTEGTVKIHIAAILRGLQSRNRTEAVVMARRLGIEG
jgi:DNA-binding NarL/FixJ family response regulator